MNWNGTKVLVTGAGGFIGSHLAERLVRLGASTHCLVHYNALGSWGWLDQSVYSKEMKVFAGDVCDRDSLKEAFDGIEVVFHLAALIAIPYSYRVPGAYIRTNIEGAQNVFQLARGGMVRRIVHTSTSEVYGSAQFVPITETHPLHGQSPYSASKIGADMMAEAFHASFDLPIVIVRPFNTFGPRQSTRAVIPTIIGQCLNGDSVELGSTAPTRDLNFVSNTVDGYIKAAECDEAVGQTIQFGSGREISIGDLANLIASLIDKEIRIVPSSHRTRPEKSEVTRLLADNTRARDLLGWSPIVSLDEGLVQTIEWMKSNLARYRTKAYAI